MRPLRDVTLVLLGVYVVAVLASQAALISWLTPGLRLPEPLAIVEKTANISLLIESRTSVEFTVDSLDFGQGFVNSTCNNCTMDTEGAGSADSICCRGEWNSPLQDGLLIENNGNTYVSLTLSANQNASSWIGGNLTQPSFQIRIAGESAESHASANGDDTADSCLSSWKAGTFTEMTTSTIYLCGNESRYDFSFANTRNEAHIMVGAVIPRNAQKGSKGVTLTLTATSP